MDVDCLRTKQYLLTDQCKGRTRHIQKYKDIQRNTTRTHLIESCQLSISDIQLNTNFFAKEYSARPKISEIQQNPCNSRHQK